jgi:hypothetical protein
MRRLWLTATLLLGLGLLTSASDLVTYESITVAATAVGFTTTTTNPAGTSQMSQCSLRLETAQVRFRWDGQAPTATEGVILDIGDVLAIRSNEDARRMLFIRTGATSGVLKAHCWR